MSTILTSAIIESAKASVDTYISSIESLNGELEQIMNTLTSSNFNGEAAEGYKDFYTNKVLPAITENLTQQGNSITASIKSLLDNIQQQLLNSVDPDLGDFNREPSQGASVQ